MSRRSRCGRATPRACWDGIGTLAPGSHADLIVVDRDPLTCPLDELPATRVLRTVVGGQTVYDAGAI